MLVYGIISLYADTCAICTVADEVELPGYIEKLAGRCDYDQLPFVYRLGDSELRWYSPADESFMDFDELSISDDDWESWVDVTEQFYSDESHYHKLIIDAFDDFSQRLRGIIPYLR